MKKRLLYLILPIITLILEMLPYGAVLNFMRPPIEEGAPIGNFRELYSYFSLTPFGYANFAPLITAVITCILLALLVVYTFTGKEKLRNTIKVITLIGTIISLGPLMFGINFFSIVGALISVSLLGETILLFYTAKDSQAKTPE